MPREIRGVNPGCPDRAVVFADLDEHRGVLVFQAAAQLDPDVVRQFVGVDGRDRTICGYLVHENHGAPHDGAAATVAPGFLFGVLERLRQGRHTVQVPVRDVQVVGSVCDIDGVEGPAVDATARVADDLHGLALRDRCHEPQAKPSQRSGLAVLHGGTDSAEGLLELDRRDACSVVAHRNAVTYLIDEHADNRGVGVDAVLGGFHGCFEETRVGLGQAAHDPAHVVLDGERSGLVLGHVILLA